VSDVYDQLAYPSVDGLNRTDCEYLAYEDSRIAAAAHARAAELFATYKTDVPLASNVVLAISELRALGKLIQASAVAYRDAQRRAPNTLGHYDGK
jgi:hypothetical protein